MGDEISVSQHRVERELGQDSPRVRRLHGDQIGRNRSRRDVSILEMNHAWPVGDRLDIHVHCGPVGATLTRLTRCVTVSVPLAQLSLVTMLGKMNLTHWRRSRDFSQFDTIPRS